jgi:hypothetical protein
LRFGSGIIAGLQSIGESNYRKTAVKLNVVRPSNSKKLQPWSCAHRQERSWRRILFRAGRRSLPANISDSSPYAAISN